MLPSDASDYADRRRSIAECLRLFDVVYTITEPFYGVCLLMFNVTHYVTMLVMTSSFDVCAYLPRFTSPPFVYV